MPHNNEAGAGDGRGAAVPAYSRREEAIRSHADSYAARRHWWIARNHYFHDLDVQFLRLHVPPGKNILDLGCGNGDLLAALEPELGVGIDLSASMIAVAQDSHPGLRFKVGNVEDAATITDIQETAFDFIILTDTIGSLEDCQTTFAALHGLCDRETRIIVSYYSYFWGPILRLSEAVGLKMPQIVHNFLRESDIVSILALADFDVVHQERRLLVPRRLLGVGEMINRFLAPLPVIRKLCLRNYTIARSLRHAPYRPLSASVVIPCRNERGNIEPALRRLPHFAPELEVIFVEGHSTDGTLEEIHRVVRTVDSDFDVKVIEQDGIGKGDAVRKGFDMANGEVLMILDADLTVAPEDLPKFYHEIVNGRGNVINGSRAVYPMEHEAMRFLNIIANAAFARTFSWLLNQRITDTLCGTKVLTRAHYRRIAEQRAYFGDFDPFGDFELLFGASKCNLKLLEIPVRYARREYGETQISRFSHGLLLFKMVAFAFMKLKAF